MYDPSFSKFMLHTTVSSICLLKTSPKLTSLPRATPHTTFKAEDNNPETKEEIKDATSEIIRTLLQKSSL